MGLFSSKWGAQMSGARGVQTSRQAAAVAARKNNPTDYQQRKAAHRKAAAKAAAEARAAARKAARTRKAG